MSRPPYHPRINSHAHVHSASSSNLDSNDKVASASTALERVFGLLDGFEDDMDCPLCLEEMDISDLNFKPCPCGYQICRFCWHHIKENLNGLCPACRAPYDDETVEFKAIKPDELKRLQAAKKIRDKRRKDDALTVKNMANIRVRQRAQVHVQGMTTKIANEDTLNQLKGTEQFGQYGKVVKLFMSKRSSTVTQLASTHPHYQPVNVYVNYRTAAEASHCIAAIDGSTTGDGHKLKAIWGTTRYCPTYLKGGKCNNENCMQAHEPGEEIEGAGPTSREEMLTYVAMGESDTQRSKASNAVSQIRKQQEAATLPPTASWATKNAMNSLPVTPIVINSSLPPLSATMKPPLVPRPIPVSKPQTHPLPARPATRLKPEAAAAARVARAPSPTPVSPVSPSAELPVPVAPAAIPVVDTPSPVASSSQPSSPPPPSLFSDLDSMEPVFANGAAFASHARSIARPPSVPFPELDFGGGAFSFSLNLDVKGKGRAVPLAGEDARSTRDFANLDGFGRESSPPSVAMASNASSNSQALSYLGSFDPFSDTSHYENGTDPHSGTSSPPPSADELSRRSSRFGFARRGSMSTKGSDLTSALARNAFAGRESPAIPMGSTPFAPPGLSQSRPSSSGFNLFATASSALGDPREGRPGGAMETSSLWSTGNLAPTGYASSALPPALLRTFVSPAQSVTTSPQLSPRPRIGSGYNPSNGAGNGAGASLPPGIALNQNSRAPLASFPLPAASFPLPPPAPRAPGGSSGGPGGGLGKDDLFALIAAAQASAPKTQAATPESYPFNDPAILNARLASAPHYASPMNTGPPPLSGYHALEHLSRGGFGPEQQQHLQQQQLQQQQLQLQQQQLQQQAQQQQLQQQAQQQQQQQAYQNQILLQQQQQHLQQQQQQHPAYYGPPGVQRQPMMNSGFRR